MDTRGHDKVMWGTNSWGLKRCKEEFMELPIRDECKKKILRDNAIQVFKLPLSLYSLAQMLRPISARKNSKFN